jgi:lactate dehydrogenase-like 2-hydroxyacid dehydrogenase
LPRNHALFRLPGAIMTPHMAASYHKVRHAMADVVMDDLESFFQGKGVKNRVTNSMLERMT